MCEISIYEAKTQLSKYISMLSSGEEEEILILKNGKPVAKLISSEQEEHRLGAGIAISGTKPFALKDPDYKVEELFGY